MCKKKQYERNSSVVQNVIFNLFSLNCNIIVLARTFICSPCSFLILILIGISSVEICKFRSDFSSILQKRWKPLVLLLKRKKRRKIVEQMSFMKSPVLRLLSMKGKIIEVTLNLYNFKKRFGSSLFYM